MVTTVYWKSNFSHEDSGVEYILKYNCDNKWRSVSCLKPQWHKNSGEISCVILTCETTPSEEYYCEIRVEAHLNSTGNFTTTPSVLHDPISHSTLSICFLYVCFPVLGITCITFMDLYRRS